MSKTRINVAPAAVITRAEMEQKVARIAKLKVAEQARVAEMNEEIEAAKRRHAGPLDTIHQELDVHCEDVREWAEANPADFGKLRSLDLTHAVIGWRTGNPALKTLRGWTWDRVLEALVTAANRAYVRESLEVNKQAILDDRNSLSAQELRAFGVEVKQTDSFYIEAKIETTSAVMKEGRVITHIISKGGGILFLQHDEDGCTIEAPIIITRDGSDTLILQQEDRTICVSPALLPEFIKALKKAPKEEE